VKKHSRETDDRVKLQVPVDPESARQIDELAARMGHSRSWMVAELLQVIVDQKKRFADWWTWRLINAGIVKPVQAIVQLFGKRKPRPVGDEVVYLQAYVSPELAQTIREWAVQMAQPDTKMASLLLLCAVEDHGWLIKIVTSRVVTALGGKPYHAGKTQARRTGNAEEPAK
jgi:predicted transcriptional regulator